MEHSPFSAHDPRSVPTETRSDFWGQRDLTAAWFLFLWIALGSSAWAWQNEELPQQGANAPRVGSEVEFCEEISAILTRSGCNSGTCHGSLHGKGGFRLSLKGEDASLDYRSIVEDLQGRRVDAFQPEDSLLLTKPTGQLAHQGGVRFGKDSLAYRDILRWIELGATKSSPAETRHLRSIRIDIDPRWLESKNKEDFQSSHPPETGVNERWISDLTAPVPLRCWAVWDDGTEGDITEWAKLECTSLSGAVLTENSSVSVTGPIDTTITGYYLGCHASLRLNFVASRPPSASSSQIAAAGTRSHHWIDLAIEQRIERLGISAEPFAAPEVWIRRLYLSVLGRLPSRDEQHTYLEDDFDRRDANAIDRVLSNPQYADLLALRWSDVLRNEPKAMSEQGVQLWNDWLKKQFAEDVPLSRMMRDMLVTMGSTYESPAASFHRTHREPTGAAEAVGQVFFGIRMQCAKCHNHPFDVWTQDDYYGLSAFFVPVERQQVDNAPKDKLDTHVITGDEIIAWTSKKPEILHPGRSKPVPAKTLARMTVPQESSGQGGLQPVDLQSSSGATVGSEKMPLEILADSLTEDNVQFDRNMVNRLWAHLFGRGIVDPVDDFRSSNPPSNPELLEELRTRFVEHGRSTRWLMREILMSDAFRRDSIRGTGTANDELRWNQFAGYTPHRLSAEVLQDALADATHTPNEFENQSESKSKVEGKLQLRAVLYPSVPKKHALLKAFGKPERLTDCECERSSDVSLRQSLILFNDEQVLSRIRDRNGLVQRLASDVSDPVALTRAMEAIYETFLCRSPSDREVTYLLQRYQESKDAKSVLEDLAWAVINSKEFLFLR